MTDTSKEAIAEILDALDRILGAARKMIAALEAERDEIEDENEALKSKVKALREENYQLWRARLKSETPNVATLFGVELGEVLDMVIAQQEQQT